MKKKKHKKLKKGVDISSGIWYPNKAVSEERYSSEGGVWYGRKNF